MPEARKVFVVYGRNERARRAMFTSLRSIGLEPIEWTQAIKTAGEASPYIGDILEDALGTAQAVVVLLTGDDLASLARAHWKPEDPPSERQFTPQARPNVLFEAGLALGLSPKRTILVQLGPAKTLSDLAGRYMIVMDNTIERRTDLAHRLKNAGCAVDIESKLDWQREGEFERAIPPLRKDRPLLWQLLAFTSLVLLLLGGFLALRTWAHLTYQLPDDLIKGSFVIEENGLPLTLVSATGTRKNGDLMSTGALYQRGDNNYPYCLITNESLLLVHPDPATDAPIAVAFTAPASGAYHVSATFARANNWLAGDGVDVALINGTQTVDAAHIPAAGAVNLKDLFRNNGPSHSVEQTFVLVWGSTFRLTVASRPTNGGTFAATALRATIKADLRRW